jgi:hypothetical protein
MVASDELRKEQILQELAEARSSILRLARGLPPQKQYRVFLGEWSPADLLSHLVGWDRANADATRELLEGRPPSFYEHIDRDWRSYNALLVTRYKKDDFGQLILDVSQSHQELLDLLAGLQPSEIVKDRGIRFRGWKVTIERLMKAEASDERAHAKQLNEFADAVAAL